VSPWFRRPVPRAILGLVLLVAACDGRPPAEVYAGYAEADYVRLAAPLGGTLVRLHLQRGDRAAAAAPAFRGIMLKGNAGVEVAGELWPIALFMPAAGTVAMRRYRQTRD
jgi:hypothetical protein